MNGLRFGASVTIAPTFRSRFGKPSSRLPMPRANELSTVERQKAHWMPVEFGSGGAVALSIRKAATVVQVRGLKHVTLL